MAASISKTLTRNLRFIEFLPFSYTSSSPSLPRFFTASSASLLSSSNNPLPNPSPQLQHQGNQRGIWSKLFLFLPGAITFGLGTWQIVRRNDKLLWFLFLTSHFDVDGDAKGFLSTLFKKDKSAAYIRDNQGFTPLLRAAMSARFHVVKAILDDCPQSANLRDPNGRTFLHLVRFTGGEVDESLTDKFEQTAKQLFKYREVDLQRLVQDNDGNTPLHYAIKTGNSIVAIVLTQRCLESRTRTELDLVNKEGATVSDLLAAHDVPNEVIELIRKKEPEAVYSARSSYGIHKTDMKYSANALSVVAGLLTTITFAAGIQVPGGFNEDDGSSVLLLKPAFQAFIVFNTFAMCGSMLVLFYLLWVMGIGKIHGSLVVLDLSIFLLRACFYSTLGAFTTGVYVTTSEKSFWLAIFVCVICFLTIFVTIKVSVANITRLGKWVSKSTRMMISSIRDRYDALMTAIPFQPIADKDKVDVIVD